MAGSGSLPEMPCGPILELNGQRKRFHVPFGLKPLMEQMIRKVLNDQPENIYEYLACFMEDRVRKKEEEEAKQKEEKAWEPSPEESLADFLQSLRTTPTEADHYAIVIQTAFRGHLAREKVKVLRGSRGEDQKEAEEQEADESDEEEEDDGEVLVQNEDYYDDEDGNMAEDEEEEEDEGEEDYTRTYNKDETDEEFEESTGDETISEMEDLAEEMEVLTIKSPTSSKYQLELTKSKADGGAAEEEQQQRDRPDDTEEGEEEEDQEH